MRWIYACGLLAMASVGFGQEEPAAERGKRALLTRAFVPAAWASTAYDNAWKHWQPPRDKQPEDYDRAFREYYGLHEAPYANGKLPMGLREGTLFFTRGIANDCLVCHGGSILGKSYVGLGNASVDLQAIFEDLARASNRTPSLPFTFGNVRGTTEAGAMAVFLWGYREPDLTVRLSPHGFALRDDLCEDAPAWWLLKKKKTMYHVGSTDARSVRSIMQFMLSPTNGPATFAKEEATFTDIQAYLLSLTPPKYPFPVDEALARQGQAIFERTCTQCHGRYGEEWTYPNKIVPIDEIGTDRTRFEGIPKPVGDLYNRSWFAKEKQGMPVVDPVGYQAPPLDGVWATAPYFHNGSVPTLMEVLNSKARPTRFTRSYRTDEAAYDAVKVGWKVELLAEPPGAKVPAIERRKVYDTSQPGRGNTGHLYGDDLTDPERRAVVEYLKKL